MNNDTRSQTIIKALQEYQHDTSYSWESIAYDIKECYEQTVPMHKRSVHFIDKPDLPATQRVAAKQLAKFVSGEHRLPVDLEEACVNALPMDRRQRLLNALAARFGLLAAEIPCGRIDGPHDYAMLSRFFDEQCEAGQAINAMLKNGGHIGPQDRAAAPAAIAELNDLIAVAVSFREHIIEQTGVEA